MMRTFYLEKDLLIITEEGEIVEIHNYSTFIRVVMHNDQVFLVFSDQSDTSFVSEVNISLEECLVKLSGKATK